MTWQTVAARYVAVGERSARFRDLSLELGVHGDPVETVIWLPNGGGKSSLMALTSAVLLPASRDFTGAGREDGERRPRRLDDYVSTGDTSHTVIQWTASDADDLLGTRHELLTGAVYEWPHRQRPAVDHGAELNKLWWSAVPIPGLLDLDNLPVRDGQLLTLAEFRDRLRELNLVHPEVQVFTTSKQNEWERQLGDLGLDTALYRYQARMNTSEGGIAKVFNFNTVREFIDLVVDVVATPAQAKRCGNVVVQHAKNLFRRPALMTERQFLTDAGQLLDGLVAAHELVVGATAQHAGATEAALRLRHSLLGAAQLDDARATVLRENAERISDEAANTRRERGQHEGLRAVVVLWAADRRHADAELSVSLATETERTARFEHAAWAAAAPMAQAAWQDARAAELQRQLAPEREARSQLRLRRDAHALAARELLAVQVTVLEEKADLAKKEILEAGRHHADLKQGLRDQQVEQREVARTKAAAETMLTLFEQTIARLRADGIVREGETCEAAEVRHRSAAAAGEKRVADLAAGEADCRAGARGAGEGAAAAGRDYQELLAEVRAAQEAEEQLALEHTRLAQHDRLVSLAEADTRIAVWGDQERLRHALIDAVARADAAALLVAVEAAEDKRLLAGVDTTGLLPAPAATINVVDVLTKSGVVAETGWASLVRDYAEPERLRAAITRPDVVSGVVVQDDATRDRARSVLATEPTLAHIPLVTSADVAKAVREDVAAALPTVPLHDGLHLSTAAATAAERLRSVDSSREQRRDALVVDARKDRELLGDLEEFWRMHPNPDSLDAARTRSVSANAAAERTLGEQTRLSLQRDQLEQQAEAARQELDEARSAVGGHHSAANRLAVDAETEQGLDGHRDIVRAADRRADELARQVAELESERDAVDDQIRDLTIARQNYATQAEQVRSRARQLSLLDSAAPPADEMVAAAKEAGLGPCLATFETLSSQWNLAASGSVLEARLAAAIEGAIEARGRADRILGQFPGDRTALRSEAERRSSRHTSSTCESEAATASTTVDAAIAATAHAVSARTRARAALAEARAARAKVKGTTAIVDFEDADAAEDRAVKLTRNIAELTSRENALANQREATTREADAASQLTASLRDQADRLPVEGRVEQVGVEPFAGDLEAARTAARLAARRCDTTRDELALAKTERTQYQGRAARLAATPAYKDITLTLRERLTDTDPIRLGAKAGDYAAQVTTRISTIDDLLRQIGEDEQRISEVVSAETKQLLSRLAAAARASELPAGLGGMSGKFFLHLRFDHPSEEELTSRVNQQIITLLGQAGGDTKSLPSGEKILRECVHAAVGVRGFRVEVLKPNEHMLEQRVPVTDVARFSDGEKVTTCVLLYCAFARRRQQGRSGGATGTLMLDNPFGRASNAQLVALQLAVAKSQRVHLVYTTGLEDMGALLQFRGLIRLRNRRPVDSTDGFVQHESSPVREVDGVHVTRATAPVPPGLNKTETRGEPGTDEPSP